MNISRKWLKEFVDIEASDREYAEVMTIAGQKVETTERLAMGEYKITDLRLIFENDERFLRQF